MRNDGRDVRLVTLEHDILLHPTAQVDDKNVAIRVDKPVRLRYTPAEWVAFYLGTREGDFQEMYNNPHYNLLRDSKDPTGPIFVIPGINWRPFMDAVQRGKYDVPKRQETSIAAKFKKPQQ